MGTALDVAAYLVRHAAAEEEPEYLTPLRLQKLLYYAQGWALATLDRPLFDDRIEAWARGPVVRSVYDRFKAHGSAGIPPEQVADPELAPEERDLIDRVWEAYKDFSAISLSKMSHEEDPWKNARGALPPEASSSREITKESLKAYFSKLSRGER